MYKQFVYENSILGSRIMTILNRYASEILAETYELHIEDSDKSLGFSIGSNQEIALISLEVKRAMLEAERRKAEAFNMMRLKETLR